MNQSQNVQIDWDIIIETIKAEKCILFLGPEIFTDEQQQPLEQQLVNYLHINGDPKIRVYDDGLFFFRERALKTLTYYRIKNFYAQSFPRAETLLEKIAQIPFHFIIFTTPDKKMAEVFQRLNLKHSFDFYWKNQAADERIKVPTSASPLVYNFFGCIDRQESLLLTHDDIFDYFESIFQGKTLASELKHHLVREADNFIFLGIPFDKWYMQLLLRILHMHKEEEFVKYASNLVLDNEIKTLCYDHFRINFIPNKIEMFIDEIYKRCDQAGILRKAGEQKPSIIDQMTDWVARDEIDRVFHAFVELLDKVGDKGDDLREDLTLLMNRHRRLQKKVNQGIVEPEQADRESNKIRKNLLELIKEAKMFA